MAKKASKKKTPKTYKGKSTKPGGGGKFAMMKDKMMREGMDEEMAKATAAKIGRKKYGKAKFQKMAAEGRKRAASRRMSKTERSVASAVTGKAY